MKIEVTQRHIDSGLPGSTCRCPVALAVKTAMPNMAEVNIYSHKIVVYTDESKLVIDPPLKVLRFIGKFDNRRKVKPFTFELEF